MRNAYKYFVMKPKGTETNWEAICRCNILPECMDKGKRDMLRL